MILIRNKLKFKIISAQNDSGGPLVVHNRVIGIASLTQRCAEGIPDVFTKVAAYLDWIEKTMNGNNS